MLYTRRKTRVSKTRRLRRGGDGSKKAFKTHTELCTTTSRYFDRPDLRQSIIQEYGEISDWNIDAITDLHAVFDSIGLIERDPSLLQFYEKPHIIRWNTSHVVSMKYMFAHCRVNIIVEFADCRNVKTMEGMFDGSNINCPLRFNTSNKLTNLRGFLSGAQKFNNILEFTDLTGVTTMADMFSFTKAFNQPILFEHLPKLKTTHTMFYNAYSFNSRVIMDTSNVSDMSMMFRDTPLFDNGGYPLNFDTRSVTNMEQMFSGAKAFNNGGYPLDFDTRTVTNMEQMFSGAKAFNNGGYPLKFNTYNIKTIVGMFENATNFNQKFLCVIRNSNFKSDGSLYNSGIVLLPEAYKNEVAVLKAQKNKNKQIKEQIKELETRNKQYVDANINAKFIKLKNMNLSEPEYTELFEIYYPSFNELSSEQIKAIFEITSSRHSVNKLSYMFNTIGQPLEIDNISMLAEANDYVKEYDGEEEDDDDYDDDDDE